VRRTSGLVVATAFLALSAACAGAEEPDAQEGVQLEHAIVEAVVDGDTIELRDGRRVDSSRSMHRRPTSATRGSRPPCCRR
jgi:hypothetical protein